MNLVAPLSGFGHADLARAGGKGANLGELIRAGFPVPDGFVVTTDAYALIAGEIEQTTGAEMRSAFQAAAVPARLSEAIKEAYGELGHGPVAVRSSATAEDLPGAAFAGQQDTYLNIIGEEAVIQAIKDCWGSLWTDRAIAYRDKLGIDHREVRIAVVVQSLIQSEFAGVMFSANPVTGARDQIVVDASAGLGEAVVSGLVTPDHYVLDTDMKIVENTPGRREVVIRSAEDGGVTHESDEHDPVRLRDETVRDLARLAARVAEHFGRPQDIEWAYADGQIRLVQARPMTALPPPPVKLNPIQRRMGSILLDYLPIRPYPIDVSTWIPHGPIGMMTEIGRYVGVRGLFNNALQEEDGVVYRLVPQTPRPTLRLLGAPFRLGRKARRYDPARWTEDPRFAEFMRRVDELAARDLQAMTWSELIKMPREIFKLVHIVTGLRRDYLPRSGLLLARLTIRLKLMGRGHLLGDLLTGVPTKTSETNRALESLATMLRDQVPEAEFEAAFESFLAEYGHREGASPVLITPPTWEEDPAPVRDMITMLAAKPPGKAENDPSALAVKAISDHPRLRRTAKRARMVALIEAARAGVAFREDSHFYFTRPMPVLRRSLLEIGVRLRDLGVFAEPEDVFHLHLEELESIDPAQPQPELRATVLGRSEKRAELAGVRLIDPRAVFPREDDGDALAAGSPASGGTATGPVRIIREPADFGKVNSGDVLVCPYTNPSWTPLFQRAAAVVVDSGGIASHAAIVAREYGIPAVMGTGTGTSDLQDGQVVTVDGDTGRVTL